MSEKKILRTRILMICLSAALVLIVSFSAFALYDFNQLKKNFEKTLQISADNLGEILSNDFLSLRQYVDGLYADNQDYDDLCSGRYRDGIRKLGKEGKLKELFRLKADSISCPAGVFYFDTETGEIRSEFSSSLSFLQVFHINQDIKKRQYSSAVGEVTVLAEMGGEQCVLYYRMRNGKCLGLVLLPGGYLDAGGESGQTILTDGDTLFLSRGELLYDRAALTGGNRPYGYVYASCETGVAGLRVILAEELREIFSIRNNWGLLLFSWCLPLICAVLFCVIYRYIDRIVIRPVDYLAEKVEKLKREASVQGQRENAPAPHTEFENIDGVLDALVDEIVKLEKRRGEKELELQKAQLQYCVRQSNPHFFINCLSVVESLAEKGEAETLKDFIQYLSGHIRYTFKDKISEIQFHSELAGVESYLELIRIKNGEPVLLEKNIGEEMDSVMIPVMSLLTFAENSVKHGKVSGRILSLRLQAKRVDDGEGGWFIFRMSDNGNGFPEKILNELNAETGSYDYLSEHVGIVNLKYRLKLLYGEAAHCAFYNGSNGGAAAEIIIPEADRSEDTDRG